jgi:hypothetical protein
MASKDLEAIQVQDEVIQTAARLDSRRDLRGSSTPKISASAPLNQPSQDASPDFIDRISEDLRDYELDDDSFSYERVSPASSSGSDSPPSTKHLEFADEEAEELRSLFKRPLPPIPVTNTVDAPRRPPSPLPAFHFPARTPTPRKMPNSNVPKPGPAKLSTKAGLEEWLAEAKQCHYLPEAVMKQLCEMVKECLMEGEYYIVSLVPDLSLTSLSRV